MIDYSLADCNVFTNDVVYFSQDELKPLTIRGDGVGGVGYPFSYNLLCGDVVQDIM